MSNSNPLWIHYVQYCRDNDAEHSVAEQKDHDKFPSSQLLCQVQPELHITHWKDQMEHEQLSHVILTLGTLSKHTFSTYTFDRTHAWSHTSIF